MGMGFSSLISLHTICFFLAIGRANQTDGMRVKSASPTIDNISEFICLCHIFASDEYHPHKRDVLSTRDRARSMWNILSERAVRL